MEKLPFWRATKGYPANYDSETATAIEMVAKLYGTMDEMIEEHNKFMSEYETKVTDFATKYNESNEVFTVEMRQEFQDFIDTVELHLRKQVKRVEDAELYMRDNIIDTTQVVLVNMLQGENITIKENYDADNETLSFVFAPVEGV